MKVDRDIEDNLGELPATLEKTYESVWADIMRCPVNEKLYAQRAFAWILCAFNPIKRADWAEACYSPEAPPEGGFETLFDLCRNLVVWNKELDQVVFSHLSVKEYLEKKELDFTTAHRIVALSCLCYLTGQRELPTVCSPIPLLLHTIIHEGIANIF